MSDDPAKGKKPKRMTQPTEDGHYLLIDGRKWRRTNPNLPEEERKRLVSELMRARRAVGTALKSGDKNAEAEARAKVNAAKIALGERGAKWWESPGSGDAPPAPQADEPGSTP